MKMSTISGYAIDMGGTKTAAAKILGGVVVNRINQSTDGRLSLDAQLDVIEDILRQLGWRRSGEAIGLTVTGRVSATGLWSAVNANTLTELNDAPLARLATERFGNVTVSNDAAATTLAEYHFGAGQGTNSFIYMTVSTGVGGGIIVNGRPVASGRGLAGHIGFTTVRGAGAMCGCGRQGTVESIASGTAIARTAAENGHDGLTGRDVFEASYAGHDWADRIIDRSAQALAELCANLTAVLDPDCIAIGGSVGMARGFIERVRRHLAKEPTLFQRPLVKASMGPDGPLFGALMNRTEQ